MGWRRRGILLDIDGFCVPGRTPHHTSHITHHLVSQPSFNVQTSNQTKLGINPDHHFLKVVVVVVVVVYF